MTERAREATRKNPEAEQKLAGTFEEDVESICRAHTELTEEDIEILRKKALRLKELRGQKDRDYFIDCPRGGGKDLITVAAAYGATSMYDFHTLRNIVDDVEEPAAMNCFRYGMEVRDVFARSFTNTPGNLMLQQCWPIRNNEKIIGVRIEESKPTEEQLEERARIDFYPPDKDRYPYLKIVPLAECVDEGIIILNEEKQVVYRNDRAQKMYKEYGYLHDIHGAQYDEVSFHGKVHVGPGIENSAYTAEARGAKKVFRISEYCYQSRGDQYFYILVLKDISEEKENKTTIAQKDVVVREAHHRVKNNLQMVYNLLDMQRRRAKDEDVEVALNEAMSRIGSIASAYEMLSQTGTEQVNIRELLEKVLSEFRVLLGDLDVSITATVRGTEVYTDMSGATDIALVVNELLQNTAKHAFKNRKEGRVSVSLVKRPLYSEIVVSDDGNGFNPDDETNQGLGYQLAENIVEYKLKGKISRFSDPTGTTVVFTFKCLENQTEEENLMNIAPEEETS